MSSRICERFILAVCFSKRRYNFLTVLSFCIKMPSETLRCQNDQLSPYLKSYYFAFECVSRQADKRKYVWCQANYNILKFHVSNDWLSFFVIAANARNGPTECASIYWNTRYEVNYMFFVVWKKCCLCFDMLYNMDQVWSAEDVRCFSCKNYAPELCPFSYSSSRMTEVKIGQGMVGWGILSNVVLW